ncbi:MAG: hypothetical protein O2971_03185 [Proteobacteria bacterium]|nr:hypothetical protein [Pseudomonadota bacterium]
MTHTRSTEDVSLFKASVIRHLLSAVLAVVCLAPMAGSATEFELARIAAQLNQLSSQLAHQLRYTNGYGNVRLSAERLAREAAKLVNAIRRNRSNSYIRSEFKDISRRYHNLEDDFLRANRSNHDPRLFQDLGFISNLYSNLSDEFYYTNHLEQPPPVYYYNVPIVSGRAVPPALRGQGNAHPGRQQQHANGKRDRRDYGRISASRSLDFDHRSAVLDRQVSNDANSRRLNNVNTRRANSRQELSGRNQSVTPRRGRSIGTGGDRAETRRLNQFE